MATLIQRLIPALVGRRGKFVVLAFWVVLVAAAAPLAGKLTGVEQNNASAWLPGAAESTKVLNEEAVFESPNTFVAVVVFTRSPALDAADRAAITADARTYARSEPLGAPVQGPLWSRDGQAGELVVPLNLGPNGWNAAAKAVSHIKQVASGRAGLSVYVTGPAGNAADSANAFKGIDGTLLYAAAGVVIFILLLTYRSPVLWLLPVMSAGIALTTAEALIYLLAKHGLVVNAESAGILTVLVFGAGTDYALLLVARYREELRRHADRHEAMAIALRRAGPAIIASASTVVAGLLCLLVAETNSTRGLGPVAAIGVVVALGAMLTLLPALLVIAGRWIFWPARPALGSTEPTASGVWARIGRRVSRRPRWVWVGTVLALAVLMAGISDLHASGLSEKQSFTTSVQSVVGEEVLAKHFPAGAGNPVVVIARAAKAGEVAAALAAIPGIAAVAPTAVKDGRAFIQGVLASAPDSPAAYATVVHARDVLHRIRGADALVGGTTAVNLDVQDAAQHDREVIVPVVLLVVLVILALLLRALLAPLLLVATVGLSFCSALGVSAEVFDHVFGIPAADSAFPLFVFVFLVALGIDYNIFLMTRVREETARYGTRPGALAGLAATGGVITSAGLVLAGTFAVLGTLPVTAFAEIGFAVAFGVLLDTLVVRSVLVTALNLEFGDHIWWPSRPPSRSAAKAAAAGEPVLANI
ncbi:MAG TPA: MMPL family transporter [Acidimicrobiales bacterium]|nr:MMPL family transporter [Acidimicrobiales bacterium]